MAETTPAAAAPPTISKEQEALSTRVLPDLRFMLHHFVQLQSSAEHGGVAAPLGTGNQQRLAAFISHLESTIDRLLKPITNETELKNLDNHLTKTLLPVKERLEQQLKQSTAKAQREKAKRAREQRKQEKLALGQQPSPSPSPERDDGG
eukprot:CAMPEP_0119271928 /NCGR_PEP_ID=MMETSP1329-20130426/8319_1 /TAXON_ID=114041 /ORGANISM="Genus nov. species nov., Strain RCC1024" /LENGTH=148 /DNA_ID=CAMNT_0007271987 /DNA_START=284 /DNA_END=726 /DNA_ORIENTATION=+